MVENNDDSVDETIITSEINDTAENNEEIKKDVVKIDEVLESNINNNLTSKKTLTRYSYGFNDEDYYTEPYIK